MKRRVPPKIIPLGEGRAIIGPPDPCEECAHNCGLLGNCHEELRAARAEIHRMRHEIIQMRANSARKQGPQ